MLNKYPLYTTVSEEKIALAAAIYLEKMLERHYSSFKDRLIGGLIFAILGAPMLYFGYALLAMIMLIIALAFIIAAFAMRVRVKTLDVALYPILALPYGDGSKALLIDPLNRSGDKIVFRISRVDLIGSVLRDYLMKFYEFSDFTYFQNLGEEPDATKVIRIEEGGTMSTIFEENVRDHMERLLKVIEERPVDQFNFKLFERPASISMHNISLDLSLMGGDLDRTIEDSVSRVNSLLESLKIEYGDLLENVSSIVGKTKEFIIREYYDKYDGLIRLVDLFLVHSLDRPKVRICPKCFVAMKEDILTSSLFPVVLKAAVTETDVVRYVCTRCGSTYEDYIALPIDAGSGGIGAALPKMYHFEVLQSKAWSRLHVSRLDEINRFISEARRLKREKYYEAVRYINDYLNQFRSSIIPMYVEASKTYSEIAANNNLISIISGAFSAPHIPCRSIEVGAEFINVMKEIELFLSGEAVLSEYIGKLSKASKVKTNIIFNETVINTLIESYKQLGQSNMAKQLQVSYYKKDLEEIERIIGGKASERGVREKKRI